MNTRHLQFLRPDEIIPELERCPVAYLPLGLLEWHGPHLPLGVDALNAEAAAEQAAEQAGGLILPTLYCGTERERPPDVADWLGLEPDTYAVGMDFPANALPSMYAREDIFAITVREQIRLTAEMGFKVLVIISGHAATNQIETLRRIAAEFNATDTIEVLITLPFVTNNDGVMEVGHASRIETAVMQHLHPDTVALENLPANDVPLKNADYAIVDYPTFYGNPTPERTVRPEDDPRRAVAADGETMLHLAASAIADLVTIRLQQINS